MPAMILGVVRNINTAKKVVETLQNSGYTKEEISVLVKENSKAGIKTGKGEVAAGAVSGAAVGGVLGGIGGLLVGFGLVTIPGIGPLLAAGPLLATLGITGAAASTATGAAVGVVAGGATGGILGALTKIGVSRERAQEYVAQLQEGAVLVTVSTGQNGSATAKQILETQGATLITETY